MSLKRFDKLVSIMDHTECGLLCIYIISFSLLLALLLVLFRLHRSEQQLEYLLAFLLNLSLSLLEVLSKNLHGGRRMFVHPLKLL